MPDEHQHPNKQEITCVSCGAKEEVDVAQLKYREKMEPFTCGLCKKGIVIGDINKLKKFVIENYETKNIVEFLIDKLKIDYIKILQVLTKKTGNSWYIAIDNNNYVLSYNDEDAIGFVINPENLNNTNSNTIISEILNYIRDNVTS